MSNNPEYNRIRQLGMRLDGFCPHCSGPLDTFPSSECTDCKFKTKERYVKNYWPSTKENRRKDA